MIQERLIKRIWRRIYRRITRMILTSMRISGVALADGTVLRPQYHVTGDQ